MASVRIQDGHVPLGIPLLFVFVFLDCYWEGWDGEMVADYCERGGFGEDWGMDERAGWTTMSL